MSSGIATALVALLALATSAVQAGQTEKPIKLADGTSAEVSRFEGVPKWQLLSHLWRHHSINVTCPEAVVRLQSGQPPWAVQCTMQCKIFVLLPQLAHSSPARCKRGFQEEEWPPQFRMPVAQQQVVFSLCALQETDVFVAKDLPALREAAEQQDGAWCGVAHWLGEQRSCCVSVSPFGDTWVAVRPRKAGLMSRGAPMAHVQGSPPGPGSAISDPARQLLERSA